MTQEDIIWAIHDKCNMTLPQSRIAWKSVMEQMKLGIVNDGELAIRRFGRFMVIIRENNGRWTNPKTGKKALIDKVAHVHWRRSHLLDQFT